MVIMLLLMSAAMLNATRKQMEGALSLLAGERIFYQQSSQATSAMNWGGQQHWSALTGWQCKKMKLQAGAPACCNRIISLHWFAPTAVKIPLHSGSGWSEAKRVS